MTRKILIEINETRIGDWTVFCAYCDKSLNTFHVTQKAVEAAKDHLFGYPHSVIEYNRHADSAHA